MFTNKISTLLSTIKYRYIILLLTILLASPLGRSDMGEQAVNALAQKCLAFQSSGSGKYLRLSNGVYRFSTSDISQAEIFFIKPTRLGEFLLTSPSGSYLGSVIPLVEAPLPMPSIATEWKVDASALSSNDARYRFTNQLTRLSIVNEYWKTHRFWWFSYKTFHVEDAFKLVSRSGCRAYPEVEVNVSGNREHLKGNINEPVRGIVDAHSHITSYEFMGGKVMHGDPFHAWGAPYALSDSRSSHGLNGSLDLIGNIFTYDDPLHQYDTRGWPDFPWWPNAKQSTHSGYYYKWIERAWLGGLRVTVTQLVENEVLCRVQSSVNPISLTGFNSCNTMDSIRLQAQRLREMQDYIDAQYGGPGKGFFRLVTSAAQAREVIADGKLAVVMGIEASETLNCGELDFCSISKIEQGLVDLHQLGIRSIFPAHKFDNQLSGAVLENGFINMGEMLSTGHYYETKHCDEYTRGTAMNSGFPIIGDIPLVGDFLGQVGVSPSYESHSDHCNTRGLTPLGVYMVNRMIDLNIIIDIDHLSADATTQVMDIMEARHFSGGVSSHSFVHRAKDNSLHNNVKRLLHAGGFVAVYNGSADSMPNRLGFYLDEIEQTPYLNGVGLGTDMSGLAGQPGPNAMVSICYPFTTEFGLTFDRQVSGTRTFDLVQDGLAHYGMLADHLQAIRERSDPRGYEALMNSAEAYLQMWERAESNVDAGHVNPL